MADIKPSQHVLSPGDKSYPHCHSVITGRKSWKTLKGKTEAVWPPYLEVALFEGTSHNFLVISTSISSFPPKVSPVINPPTHGLPNLSADSPTETASSQNISSKRQENIGPPNKSAVGCNNYATRTRESNVRRIALAHFLQIFSDLFRL